MFHNPPFDRMQSNPTIHFTIFSTHCQERNMQKGINDLMAIKVDGLMILRKKMDELIFLKKSIDSTPAVVYIVSTNRNSSE
jgi:hypothetical protein